MLAVVVALNTVKLVDLACELPLFWFPFLSLSLTDYFLLLCPRCILGMPVVEGSLALA